VAGAERDLTASRIAATQRTIVDATQLHACGIGKRAIEYRVAAGRLHVVFRGVYSFGCGELPPLALEQAALIACGEHAFLSHCSAAFVWGLARRAPALVDISVVGRSLAPRDGIRVHRIAAIDRGELRRREGLWVSSPARICLEIAATSPSDLPDVIDAGLANRLLNRRDIEAVLRGHGGQRGAARLAAFLGDESAMTITRSRAEKAMLKLIRDSGLPVPDVNVRLGPYRPDFMWRSHRLIVELDSYGFHAGPRAYQNDRDKDLFYRGAGFDALRLTRAHVVYNGAMVVATVARALALREPG
jgi:very-short-patch-repair endonuclease